MKSRSPVGVAWPEQSFVLSRAILEAVSFEEVDATYEQMAQLGLARPPFERMDIRVPESMAVSLIDQKTGAVTAPTEEGRFLIYRYDGSGVIALSQHWSGSWKNLVEETAKIAAYLGHAPGSTPTPDDISRSAAVVMRLLIVLLATRNVVKERVERKTLRLGIGSRERNRYTTTLKIGTITEREDGAPGGGSGVGRRPHLRRGHIRRQHHGPRNELIKSVWIDPVFVNADESWTSSRTAYNVSIGGRP